MLALRSNEDKIFAFTLGVLFIVFNQNLGLMPLLADEPTRALVSLEMLLRNNYIFPTLGNEAYLNKPPLFNWMLAGLMYLVKDYTEWHLRIISIIPLFAIAITHYIIIAKEVNKNIALWSSLAFLTCGRILFYDSMMAYIDPLFSLIIVLNTYWVFIQSRKPLSLYFFAISYLLCLLAFFLKGLPALSFQACTLTVLCVYRKNFKSLLSLNHLTGIAVFLLFTAIYYYEYGSYASTSTLFTNIVSQSSQRTPIATDIVDSLIHLVQFPIQFILDFSPFSFFIVFAFRKNVYSILKENEFIFLSFLFIISNIWLYWISSETRARYLFMFLPMFFTIVFYMYEKHVSLIAKNIIRILTLILSIALILAVLILTVLQRFDFIENKELVAICIVFTTGIFIFYNFRYKLSPILSLVAILIFIRLTFNFYILPLREKESPESINRVVGKKIGAITKNERLMILNYAPINHDILYYLTQERSALVEQKKDRITVQKYLTFNKKVTTVPADSVSSYRIPQSPKDTIHIADSTFVRIRQRLRSERMIERKKLQKGYYICTELDVVRYQLKTIMLFDVTHEGQKLALAQK